MHHIPQASLVRVFRALNPQLRCMAGIKRVDSYFRSRAGPPNPIAQIDGMNFDL
jgi:hypothetical protein